MPPSYLEVAFPIPLQRTFHYQLPSTDIPGPSLIGRRVLAPFGKTKSLVGYAVGTTDQTPPFQTKQISAWVDAEPMLDDRLLELARWISDRYLCSFGEALACMLPTHMHPPKRLSKPIAPEKTTEPYPSIRLTKEQQTAWDRLAAGVKSERYAPFLLRGITDSGKTELYLRAIDQTLEQGRQALFLLPEIALTPPFVDRLKARYADRTAMWHSGVTPNERYRIWNGVRKGEIQVVLGARSAVFAPFPNLGVLVVDEEHEPAYKQEDRPRYHAREVARKRAEQSNAVLILGSATPSLESYWQTEQGIYTLLEMTSRVEERSLPVVTLIDQRPPSVPEAADGVPRKKSPMSWNVFSEPLRIAIEQRLARREQVMLFINRRGFTPFLRCNNCGWVARCPRCSTTMALHHAEEKGGRSDNKKQSPFLQCHACLHREGVVIQCPQCKRMKLRSFGIGTQRVEEEVKNLFPFATIARLDRDAASSPSDFERVYRSFAEGKADVLVGTQMIAKGFDFPNVTLVGVVDADVSLHQPDFRSAERTFDLITQVAGRTGRGARKGSVLVQTHHPEHYALQSAQAHDYPGFYKLEIPIRELLRYPPFVRIVHLLVRGPKEDVVQKAVQDLYEKLEALGSAAELLGPAPAPYSRLRNQYRYQILLKGDDAALAPLLNMLRSMRLPKAFLSVDVDPMDLL